MDAVAQALGLDIFSYKPADVLWAIARLQGKPNPLKGILAGHIDATPAPAAPVVAGEAGEAAMSPREQAYFEHLAQLSPAALLAEWEATEAQSHVEPESYKPAYVQLLLKALRAALPAPTVPAVAAGAGEAEWPQKFDALAAAGRGEWAWKEYKPTQEEMQAAFKNYLAPGAEVYCVEWSRKEPFPFFPEVNEQGVSFYCAGWADKAPVRKTWDELFRYLHANPGLSYLSPAPQTAEPSC